MIGIYADLVAQTLIVRGHMQHPFAMGETSMADADAAAEVRAMGQHVRTSKWRRQHRQKTDGESNYQNLF